MENPNAIYLGDGVYAEFDGVQIWIWTSNGYVQSPKIAINEDTLQSLNIFARRWWGNENG